MGILQCDASIISDVALQLSEQLFNRIDQFLTAIQPCLKGIPLEIMTLAPHFQGKVPQEYHLSPYMYLIGGLVGQGQLVSVPLNYDNTVKVKHEI